MSLSDEPLLNLFQFSLGDGKYFRVLEGSDFHAKLDQVDWVAAKLQSEIRGHRDVDLVMIIGDIFDTEGESSQRAIGEVYRAVAPACDGPILRLDGNNDLRGAGSRAWNNFGSLPKNVIGVEDPCTPIILDTRAGKIVAGNIFYDFEFIDPAILGVTEHDIFEFYKDRLDDGKYLLDSKTDLAGQIKIFKQMAQNLAQRITPDISMVVTHCLPYPLVTFRVPERTEQIERYERELSIPFICNPEEDAKLGVRKGQTAQEFRDRWNFKSLVMGSDVLTRHGANPRDGLVVFSGHNHRAEDRFCRIINGKKVYFCSYQYPLMMRDEPFAWDKQGTDEVIIRPARGYGTTLPPGGLIR